MCILGKHFVKTYKKATPYSRDCAYMESHRQVIVGTHKVVVSDIKGR